MPYCDTRTGKIVGCKKGTKEWFHEEGHIKYDSSYLGIKNSYRMTFSFYSAVTSLIISFFITALNIFIYSSLVFIIIFWYYFFYEEIWCWRYSNIKMKGGYNIDGRKIKKKTRRIKR